MLCGLRLGVRAANLGEGCDPTPSYRYETLILNTIQAYQFTIIEPPQQRFLDISRLLQQSLFILRTGKQNLSIQRMFQFRLYSRVSAFWDTKIHPFPARCNTKTTYCPDNNSGCKNLLATGATCEYQRDDECAGPYSICLNTVCLVKGVPLEGPCNSEITNYTSYDSKGNQVSQTIIRDNCTINTYCNYLNTRLCISSKGMGNACDQDIECLSDNCGEVTHKCEVAADSFHQVPHWAWGVVASVIFIFVVSTLLFLWLLHRYQSKKEHEKASRFFEEAKKFNMYAENAKLVERVLTPGAMPMTGTRASMIYLATPGSFMNSGNKRPIISHSSSNVEETAT
ncbi:hypothetical protein INT43_004672 [Umbelopsis isabellina]|uniref:Uncharacterized protein n=1 Tax=Mortierella isabellina TaxID=91625 RepID=A0A8H7PG67_MORIS|nr:hypothetical protein INT43_004672 [Umbelopsis isabellina]